MLENLLIENIALIDKLEIPFGKGLNCLSGETGAGKSIIVDALSFVLGERADKSLIKYGKPYAFVQAVFNTTKIDGIIEKLGKDYSVYEDKLIISRKMLVAGKNEIRINGKIASLSFLKGISGSLADIFGQSEHLNLFSAEIHIKVLDGLANLSNLKKEAYTFYEEYIKLKKELSDLGGDERERMLTLDLLNYQIAEIEEVSPSPGEDEELSERLRVINNAERITELLISACDLLNSSVSADVSSALHDLMTLKKYTDACDKEYQRLESVKYDLNDIADELRQKASDIQFDENEAEKIEKRLSLIKLLKKKYGDDINAVLDYAKNAQSKRSALVGATERIKEIDARLNSISLKMYDISRALSEKRKEFALKLSSDVKTELSELGMKGAVFEVRFGEIPDFFEYSAICNPEGYDNVEFYMSANVGEPVKPLAKVISGGEMSRFMLAIKNITAHVESIPTMIFDEIDGGISGRIAQMVAIKLMKVSREYQCIVITHLPQIAAIADRNYLIKKHTIDETTISTVSLLDSEGKINEIGRLTGGNSDYAYLLGKDLIEWGEKEKKKTNTI